MFRSLWLRNLLDVAHSRKVRRRLAGQRCKPVRPILEALEDRITPAQPVGTYGDLVSAIGADTAANTNYVIDITSSFTFTGGQVTISKLASTSTLTIEGQGGVNFTLTGSGSRLFNVANASQNVTLKDLTLTGGSGVAFGGAIEDAGGKVTLSGVTVKGNTAGIAGSIAYGGGVCVSGGGILTVNNSTIANNVAQGAAGTSTSTNGIDAEGGGVFVSGASTVQISDSTLSNNRAVGGAGFTPTAAGAGGGTAATGLGGGVCASGSGWTVMLKGDTLSGNAAVGGAAGNGAAGSNATGANHQGGNGGSGGNGGAALGGGLYAIGSGTLTVLNDLAAPLTDPSIFIGNTTTSGLGGTGGAGGQSTGTAKNANGGNGGAGGAATGGGLMLDATFSGTANIGNTTFYGNRSVAANGGVGGAAGTGGSGAAGTAGTPGADGQANGAGVFTNGGTFVMVNSTVANNIATAGAIGTAIGAGVSLDGAKSSLTATLDNDTITLNSAIGGTVSGGGLTIASNAATLFNNLIQGNTANGSPSDLLSNGSTPTPLTNATNNFISAISPGTAVNTATNTVGNNAAQLGAVVGVNGSSNPTGGPIYYPLSSGAVSAGAGTTSVLSTIAGVEGTTQAKATDEIGSPRSSNGAISLGAVQTQLASPPPSPSPSPPPSPPPPPALKVPPLLAFIDSLLGGIETVNGNGTETITDSVFGIPLIVSTFDSSGNLESVTLFGINITFLFA
jgi:hypothetical protein